MKLRLTLFFLLICSAWSQTGGILDRQASPCTLERPDLTTLLYALGRAYKINITVGPGVQGVPQLHFNGGTLRDLFSMVTSQNDLFLEETPSGIVISRYKTFFFNLEYPAGTRTSSTSSSVSLSPATSGSSSNSGGLNIISAGNVQGITGNATGQGAGDSTSLQVSEKSAEESIWASLSTALKAKSREGEQVTIDSPSGLISVETTPSRYTFWSEYIRRLNERMHAQVMIELRIDEVQLDNAHKLGLDWSQITTSIGSGVDVGFSSTTNITSLGSTGNLPPDSMSFNFSAGKLSSVLHALNQQGTVRNVATSTTRVMNNQKAYVKVGIDQSFFTASADISVVEGSTASSTINRTLYKQDRQTFGVVMPVTAQISEDGWIILILEPARTRLNSIRTGPNGKDETPVTNDERISTMVRLRTNETALLGGLTTIEEASQSRRIPVLGSIPILGALARSDAKASSSSQLLFYVTARIIPSKR